MSEEHKLEEQVLSQAVESQLSSQFDQAEALDVEVHTDLLKAVQGQADSVSVAGKGVVVQPGVRVEEMELRTDHVAVNPLSVLLGQVKFSQPVDTAAHLVMTEADLNQTLNSDYVRGKLFPVMLNVEGRETVVEIKQPMSIDLQTPGKVGFSGNLLIPEAEGERQVSFSAIFCPRSSESPAMLEAFRCLPGQGVSIEFAIALLQKGKELMQLPYLEVEGMALQIKQMTVEPGILTLEATAHVYQIPQT